MPTMIVSHVGSAQNTGARPSGVGYSVVVRGAARRVFVYDRAAAVRSAWAKSGSTHDAAYADVIIDTATSCAIVLINWNTPDVQHVILTRVHPDGTKTVVRNSPVTLSDDWAVFWDCEAPLNTDIYYEATSDESTSMLTTNVINIVSADFGWLKNPLNPTKNVRLDDISIGSPLCDGVAAVTLHGLDDETYEATDGVFSIIGAARPHVISQIRHDLVTSVHLGSRQHSDILALRALLSSGVLLLQVPTAYGWGLDRYGSDYVRIGNVTSGRTSDDNRFPYRTWRLPATAVNIPASTSSNFVGSNNVGVSGATWDDLAAAGLTWNQLAALNTWLDTMQGKNF